MPNSKSKVLFNDNLSFKCKALLCLFISIAVFILRDCIGGRAETGRALSR